MVSASEVRTVRVPGGAITYTLTRKSVKNKNIRVSPDGSVFVSIPRSCPKREADELIADKADWILSAVRRMRQRRPPEELPPLPPRDECARILKSALDRVYPLVKPLGVQPPLLKLRSMTSQWGNCHWRDGYITLNTALARVPERLQDYVALHELVHFVAHDHGAGFYSAMDRLMPDWEQRRRDLRQYEGTLRNPG